jgi:hypothetical protein
MPVESLEPPGMIPVLAISFANFTVFEASLSLVDNMPAALRRSVADPARKATGRWVRLANAADRMLETPGVNPGDAELIGHAVAHLIAVANLQLEAGLHVVEIGRRSRLIRGLSEAYSGSRKVKGVGITVGSSVAVRGRGRTLPLHRHPPRQARGQLPGDVQGAGVVAVVRELVAAGVPEHVRVHRKGEPGDSADRRQHLAEGGGRHGPAPFAGEHVGTLRHLLTL